MSEQTDLARRLHITYKKDKKLFFLEVATQLLDEKKQILDNKKKIRNILLEITAVNTKYEAKMLSLLGTMEIVLGQAS